MPSQEPPPASLPVAALPLRILTVIPCPTDSPRFNAKETWRELERALKALGESRLVELSRLVPATGRGLQQRLEQAPVHILHFIGQAQSRLAANYEALVFEDSGGRARSLTVQHLSTLLREHGALRLVVLQPCLPSGDSLEGAAQMLLNGGAEAIVATSALTGRSQSTFIAKLYSSLATGYTLEEATAYARQALQATDSTKAKVTLVCKYPAARLVAVEVATSEETTAQPAQGSAAGHLEIPPAEPPWRLAARRELERKVAEGVFDVFLCHNGADKPEVKRIAHQLKDRGILPWLDEWELPPGQAWQPLLESQIASIKSAAVFVGSAGVGPWQEQELYGFLREFVSRKNPVIPVLLPDAPERPELPIFLRAMTWVDFRMRDPEPLARLIWGITGRRPLE